MDHRLKEAITAARTGDKVGAQRQLAELLNDDPEQAQGWYLLSLLVDSPQKQAAYLSKTLSLSPNHENARKQLDALQAEARLAPTTAQAVDTSEPMDVLAQSETDELPDWLREEEAEPRVTAVPAQPVAETTGATEPLPEWLKEPAAPTHVRPPAETVEESPTIVGKTAEPASKSDKIVEDLKKTLPTTPAIRPQAVRSAKQSARNLNIILGVLVTIAIVVIFLLAYLLLT